MIYIKYILIILLSVAYGLALCFIENMYTGKHRAIKDGVCVTLGMACITSIMFMSSLLEIKQGIEYVCYAIMLLIAIIPTIIQLIKRRHSNNSQMEE